MFEGIEKIDWEAMGVSAVPNIMRDLVSEKRDQAHDIIEEKIVIADNDVEIWNMGMGISYILKSDLQYLLIPFLLEALEMEEIIDKSAEYDILLHFVNYVDFEYEGEIYLQRAWKIRNTIWKGNRIFINHLNSTNKNTYSMAFSLLCKFDEYYDYLIPILLNEINSESNSNIKIASAQKFYNAFVFWNLLSESETKFWNEIKPLEDENLFSSFYNWAYPKHEKTDAVDF